MGMVVRSNINSMNANRNLSKNNNQAAKAIEKLASGYAINRAADDASGLAISEKMRSQITGLDQGTSNAIEGVGLIQTAEGAMTEIHDMLNRMVELATKAANGTISDEVDREAIQAEVDVLIAEIDRIAEATNYNGIPLLLGVESETVIADIRTEIVTGFDIVYNTEIQTEFIQGTTKLSSSTTTYLDVSSGVDETNSTYNSAYYKSDPIELAPGATSVPSGAEFDAGNFEYPYVIEMEIVTYNEDDGAIENSVVSLTVERDPSTGVVSAIGSNGVDYINATYQTEYDKAEGNVGYMYISDFETNGITEFELSVIMEVLLNSISSETGTDLDAGGGLALYWTVTPDKTDAETSHLFWDENGNRYNENSNYPYFQNGESYSDYVSAVKDDGTPNFTFINSSTYPASSETELYKSTSNGQVTYNTTSSVTTYSSSYGEGMSIYGGSGANKYDNTGRVLGVISTVSQGNNVSSSVGSPSSFDIDYWLSNSADPSNLDPTDPAVSILGITTVGESARSEIEIPEPVSNADIAGMTAQEIADLVITIEKTKYIYPNDEPYEYPEDYPEEMKISEETEILIKQYVTVTSDFVDTDPSMFGDDVTIIYGDATDSDFEIIDKLCEKISDDFDITRVTRKLDDTEYDIPGDYNEYDKFTLQIGVYSYSKYTWDTEPGRIDTEIVTETHVPYEREEEVIDYEVIEYPIYLHVGDQNEGFNKVYIYIDPMTGEALEIKPLYVLTEEQAGAAIDQIKAAINYTSQNRANLGAIQNRLECTVNANNNTSENMSAAKSVIKDADMAKEMIEYTKMNILTQSAQSMLVQSNQSLQQILSLLG